MQKLFARLILVKEGTNTLTFYIFEFAPAYDAEYSTQSGAKKNFIKTLFPGNHRGVFQKILLPEKRFSQKSSCFLGKKEVFHKN